MASDDYLTVSLDFSYGTKHVLRNIEFSVPNGSTLGILGPNGAGKTTLLKCLTGLNPITSGTTWRSDIVFGALVETPLFPSSMTIEQHLKMLGYWNSSEDTCQKINSLLNTVGLSGENSTVIKHLSLGQKQRLGLARALWRNPNTLILDEPTNGLDPQGILDIREMILGFHKEGRNVIVASHLISEILHCCTHVLVLHQGNVRYFGTLNSLKKDTGLLIDSVDRSSMIELLKLQNISFVEQIDGIQIDGSHSPELINKYLANSGIYLNKLQPIESNIERTLLQLMGQQ